MVEEGHDNDEDLSSSDVDSTFRNVDPTFSDVSSMSDSALGDDDVLTQTRSVASSIYNYRTENGRTYHAYKDGSYWGPNDEQALEHQDLAHHLFQMTLNGKLLLAPISDEPKTVLDLGTGTGIWAIMFADEHPNCMITGIDLSPIQPTWRPPNCKFEIDDFNDDWTFGENKFDRIFLRSSHGSVLDRTELYLECFRALKPGGYLEEAEYSPHLTSQDDSIASDSAIADWNQAIDQCASEMPEDELCIFEHMKGYIEQAGFVNVHEEEYIWPVGVWPKDKELKELGRWAKAHIGMGLENWVLRLLTRCGWTADEVLLLCAKVRKQINTRGVHAIHRMNIVYGQKF